MNRLPDGSLDNGQSIIKVNSEVLERFPLAELSSIFMQEAAGPATNIELRGGVLYERDMEALYAGADAVLSLHRAEGFGLNP